MSGTILNFDGNEISKKEFETYKKQIGITSAYINKMVISDRLKNSNKSVKYFIGCVEDDMITHYCLVLSQMSGQIVLLITIEKICHL